MENKINVAIDEIIYELKKYIDIEDSKKVMGMITLDNILCRYCTNSMFDGGLDDIFSTSYPDEGEEGSYGYYVRKEEIDERLNETINYDFIDFDNIHGILVEFKLMSKNNSEISKEDFYHFDDYSEWLIKVTDVKAL